jgi:hypothetical protein
MLIAAVAFGCSSGEDATERAEELEEYAASLGIDADVKVDEEGGIASTTVTQGGMTVGSNVAVPEDFPSDVAIYPDLEIFSAGAVPGGHVLQGRSDDSAEEVAAFYAREMADEGWEDGTEAEQSPVMHTMHFTKNGRTTNVNLLATGEQVAVQITIMQGG